MKFLVFLIFTMMWISPSFATDYQFVSIAHVVEQQIGTKIIKQIYQKAGLDITVSPMPGRRAEYEATTGQKDGEIMRIWSYGENNSHMVRVPTPYYKLETTGFRRVDNHLSVSSTNDLTKYKLARVRGVKHTDNLTSSFKNIHITNKVDHMFKALLMGRIDLALTSRTDGKLFIKKNRLSDKIIPLEYNFATLDLYHYLHPKHKNLSSRVDKVIQSLIESGELSEIITKAESEVF